MKILVRSQDFDEIAKLVGRRGADGIKISEVVDELTKTQQMPASKARYVVRSAIDKGAVRTDRNFKLHLTTAG